MAHVERTLEGDAAVQNALSLGREFFKRFQVAKASRERRDLFALYRDRLDERAAAALDAVFSMDHAIFKLDRVE